MASQRRSLRRGLSWKTRGPDVGDQEEESLLGDADEVDEDGLFPPRASWTTGDRRPPNPHADLPVYSTIWRIRRDIILAIDDPYSVEQLRSARMNIQIIRPLVDQFYGLKDVSIVYCLLVNRMQFLRDQSYRAHHQTVNLTRASVCELIAEKITRRFNEHNPGPHGLLLLATVLVAGFEPFQNAPSEVIEENSHAMQWATQKTGSKDRRLTALEIAIITESKSFLASSACQKVVDNIYKGRLCYTPSSFIDLIPDRWKHRPISLYDPRRAPWLSQYRLIVPRTRNLVEIFQFTVLLVLYILTMTKRRPSNIDFGPVETIFIVYASGWCLDQLASILEHGWQVYTQNLWSFLDCGFMAVYTVYFIVRLHALAIGSLELSVLSIDILSCAAPVLIPRLAFNLLSENMLFVSLREMMANFLVLTLLAVWLFFGFLLSMKWLNNDLHTPVTIGKWMLWVWFGLDGTGIQRSVEFHWLLGPVLMVTFAFLGNTLFLTILVSQLSNTYSKIEQNSAAEIAFRRAVLTFEGVKSDAIFAYYPPFNILALVLLLPLKFVLTPRWFHKINVYLVRFLNAPFLVMISAYERRTLWISSSHHRREGKISPLQREFAWLNLSRLWSVHGDLQAVFDTEPPQSVLDSIAAENDLSNVEDFVGVPRLPDSMTKHRKSRNNKDHPKPDLQMAGGTDSSSDRKHSTPAIHFDSLRRPSQLENLNQQDQQQQPDTSKRKPDSNSSSSPPSHSHPHPYHHIPSAYSHPHHTPGHPQNQILNPVSRKDSLNFALGSDAGNLDTLHDILGESSERLEGLEDAVKRIEGLLGRVVAEGMLLGDGGGGAGESADGASEGVTSIGEEEEKSQSQSAGGEGTRERQEDEEDVRRGSQESGVAPEDEIGVK